MMTNGLKPIVSLATRLSLSLANRPVVRISLANGLLPSLGYSSLSSLRKRVWDLGCSQEREKAHLFSSPKEKSEGRGSLGLSSLS
jgi:hypothetical protein